MRAFVRDLPGDSRKQLPGAGPAVPALATPRAIQDSEWGLFRARARVRVTEAHQRALDARSRREASPSRRSSVEVARAEKRWQASKRALLVVDILFATRARRGELLAVRLETFEWFPDGSVSFLVPGKARARSRDEISSGAPLKVQPRLVVLLAPLAGRLRAWLVENSPTAEVPAAGPFWSAGGERSLLSDDMVERDVDAIAREAGVQKYLAPNPRAAAPGSGREKKSHKFLFHAHAIREYAERLLIRRGKPKELVARSDGHSERVFDDHYFKVGLDEARELAEALGS